MMRSWCRLLWVPIVVLGASGCSRTASDRSAASLQHEMAAARAAGLALCPAEAAEPLPPAGRNAATYYLALSALLDRKPLSADETVAVEGPMPWRDPTAAQVARVRAVFAARRDIADLVHRAAACERCVSPVERVYAPGQDERYEDAVRLCARWLRVEAAVELYERRPASAVAGLARAFRLVRHAEAPPLMSGYLSATRVDRAVLNGLASALYATNGDPATARAVRSGSGARVAAGGGACAADDGESAQQRAGRHRQ